MDLCSGEEIGDNVNGKDSVRDNVNVKVSIIICTYNRRNLFDMCFESVLNQTYLPELIEIIVVDSSDDLHSGKNIKLIRKYVEKARERGIRIKYLFQKPEGLSAARNFGIKNSEGKIVCFTDDDCVADKYWVEGLVEGFDDEKIGGVGGQVLDLSSGNTVEENQRTINAENYIDNWSFIVGANMAYRKDILERIGGFDPFFKYGGDDNDIGLRVRLSGYELKFVPKAVIYFRKRSSIRELIIQHFNYGKGISRIYKKFPEFPFARHVFLSMVQFFIFPPLYFARVVLERGEGGSRNSYRSKDKTKGILSRLREISICFVLVNSLSNLAYVSGLLAGFLMISYPKNSIVHSKLDFLNIH